MDTKNWSEAKTMTQSIPDRLKDLNWSLTEFDRIIDVILSNLTTIKEALHEKNPEKEEIIAEYRDILNFKIETVYSLLIRLEELIFNTTFVYYKKYRCQKCQSTKLNRNYPSYLTSRN